MRVWLRGRGVKVLVGVYEYVRVMCSVYTYVCVMYVCSVYMIIWIYSDTVTSKTKLCPKPDNLCPDRYGGGVLFDICYN